MRLSGLSIYPLKSAGGIQCEGWPVGTLGLQHDRRWMLVDPAGHFITQRELPRLCLVRTAITTRHLELHAPGMPDLRLPLEPPDGAQEPVVVWGDQALARFPDPQADRWCSEFLGAACRLAFLPEPNGRAVNPAYDSRARRVGFADAFPFLLIGAASLEDLNQRLRLALPMNRFRPNLVIEGAPPFAEDGWRRIRVGSLEFDVVKPCARCVITTTDQATGERSDEPLRTLATYRRVGKNVMFGQNALHRGTGWLAVGDPVEVLEP